MIIFKFCNFILLFLILYSCSPINKQHGYLLDDLLISSEETALYLAKKFGVPDTLIRDADERQQLVQMAQQMQQQGGLPENATEALGG